MLDDIIDNDIDGKTIFYNANTNTIFGYRSNTIASASNDDFILRKLIADRPQIRITNVLTCFSIVLAHQYNIYFIYSVRFEYCVLCLINCYIFMSHRPINLLQAIQTI